MPPIQDSSAANGDTEGNATCLTTTSGPPKNRTSLDRTTETVAALTELQGPKEAAIKSSVAEDRQGGEETKKCPTHDGHKNDTADNDFKSLVDDPQSILQASLEFEKKLLPPIPPQLRMATQGNNSSSRSTSQLHRSPSSSHASLYPSIENLAIASTAELDSLQLEQTWEAAAAAAKQKTSTFTDSTKSYAGYASASAGGATSSGATASSGFGNTSASMTLDQEMSLDYAYIPSEPADSNLREADDDLVALKRAAYGGGGCNDVGDLCAASEMPTDTAGANTEATVVEYDDFAYPSDGAIQAEFVGQGGDYHYRQGFPAREEYDYRPLQETTLFAMQEEVATEATVISSGPAEKATTAAWSSSATEVVVLQPDGVVDEENIVDLDTKPPAQDYNSIQGQNTATSVETMVDADATGTVATVVDYDVHPTDMTTESVRAEFVGRSVIPLNMQENDASSNQLERDPVGVTQIEGEETAEAVVVDSGPAGKATAEAWSTGVAEEAQVLGGGSVERDAIENVEDEAKVSSDEVTTMDASDFGNGQAEVVGITDEIHPAEFSEGNAATAELVGSDANFAVVCHSTNFYASEAASIEESEFISTEETHDGLAQEAVAVAEGCVAGALGNGTAFAHQSSSLSTIPDAANGNEVYNEELQAATPVAVMAVEDIANDTYGNGDDFYDYPVKPGTVFRASTEPVRGIPVTDNTRATSEPFSRTSEVATDEPEWMRAPSFGGGTSLEDAPRPLCPPVVTATRVGEDSWTASDALPPPIPQPLSPEQATSATSRTSTVSQRSDSRRDPSSNPVHQISSNIMETLFGDNGPRRRPVELDSLSASVLPRTLLPSSVIYSEATKSWVATINTSQRALEANNVTESSKALRAFSVPTKKQAMCLARAWAPPRMHPFAENPKCFVCKSKFAVFRRACHCRNCGVCVCSSCSVQWPSKMLPATYNIKREGFFNCCKACDMLSSSFRLALLHGDFDKSFALHATGNINLTTPFANVKGELFYPVHCAVLGGNLKLLKWLVDEHCCPLRSIRVSSGKQKDTSGSYTPILTSKGRSLLTIALVNRNIGIVRYLVVEKRMLLWAEKGLSTEVLVQNLDLVLRVLPEEILVEQNYDQSQLGSERGSAAECFSPILSAADYGSLSSLYPTDNELSIRASGALDDDLGGSSIEDCIICFSNPIDCVVTPCGHQICCLECSQNINRCPVCSIDCSFIRVFRA